MALPSDPDCKAIATEFGSSTRPFGINDYDLAWMHSHIFGSSSHNRRDFDGYGQNSASVSSAESSDTKGGYVTIYVNISTNVVVTADLPCVMQVQYQENDGSVPEFGTWVTLSLNYTYNSGGNKTIHVQLPKENQSYHVRMRFRNKFNFEMADHNRTNAKIAQSSGPERFAQPSIHSAKLNSSFTDADILWNYDDSKGDFSARKRYDGGTPSSASLTNSDNWGTTTNPKTGTVGGNQFFPNNMEVSIKKDAYGGIEESLWSLWYPVPS